MKQPLLPVLWFVFSSFIFSPLKAQPTVEYQIVVGAFVKESNAKKFTGFVKRRFYECTYEFKPERRLFYVYVWTTNSRPEADKLIKIIRNEPEFIDSWIYTKQLSKKSLAEPTETETLKRPIEDERPPVVSSSDVPVIETPLDLVEEPHVELGTSQPTATESKKRVVQGKLFKFDIRTPDGEPLIGDVHYVNQKLGKDIATYSSVDYADVVPSTSLGTNMTIVCGIFGYREITQEINYSTPSKSKGVQQDAEGAWVVPFQLERLKSGDESVMYEVSFFKNSVSMQEKSKTDLNQLLSIMQNNPKLRIRVLGHCNGTKERSITYIGESKNYFSVDNALKKQATALELSVLRAEAVRNYLVDNGIEINRIQVKGYGGRAMIVPENHSASGLNDRIEIAITKD